MSAARGIAEADREIRGKKWSRIQGRRVGDAVIGLVGFGRIGSGVAKVLSAFKPREILICDLKDMSDKIAELERSGIRVRQVELPELLSKSDVVSLHVPRTKLSEKMINAKTLQSMKRHATLVNTARGGIIDESALFDGLQAGVIRAAAIDVFENEPYSGPLVNLPNVILTQHMGSCAIDCRAAMELEATNDVIGFLNGNKVSRLVPDEEYQQQGTK